MYQNARYLLSSVDDANCQMVVHAAEALLVNATALTDLPTEECLKGIDIDREGTFYASRELLKRDDWYTVEGLRRVITAALEKMARMSTIQTQQTKSMVDELQKKLKRAIQPPSAISTTAQ
ncbi:unnamed protein product, partial [Mesorhabditis belari]|uniref:Uncharacterized protein n=1 Tax=Mesorhabditis belari TaxID=2138241 RepID=A0AAF3F964_9BILA